MKPILHIAPSRSGHTWVGQMIRSWCPDSEYYNLENFEPIVASYFSKKDCIIVLQVRDLLNWFASCLFMRDSIERISIEWIKGYQNIMEEFYTPNHLKNHTIVYVMYDTFFMDALYREQICSELGGVYSEEKLEVIEGYGRSSFTKYSYTDKAQMMPVLDRYKQIKGNLQAYRLFLKDHAELLSIYKANYTDMEKKHFIKCLKL